MKRCSECKHHIISCEVNLFIAEKCRMYEPRVDPRDSEILALRAALDGFLQDKYLSEFLIIDGLNQHPSGKTFQEWRDGQLHDEVSK